MDCGHGNAGAGICRLDGAVGSPAGRQGGTIHRQVDTEGGRMPRTAIAAGRHRRVLFLPSQFPFPQRGLVYPRAGRGARFAAFGRGVQGAPRLPVGDGTEEPPGHEGE